MAQANYIIEPDLSKLEPILDLIVAMGGLVRALSTEERDRHADEVAALMDAVEAARASASVWVEPLVGIGSIRPAGSD